jgi:hypothetical protein
LGIGRLRQFGREALISAGGEEQACHARQYGSPTRGQTRRPLDHCKCHWSGGGGDNGLGLREHARRRRDRAPGPRLRRDASHRLDLTALAGAAARRCGRPGTAAPSACSRHAGSAAPSPPLLSAVSRPRVIDSRRLGQGRWAVLKWTQATLANRTTRFSPSCFAHLGQVA